MYNTPICFYNDLFLVLTTWQRKASVYYTRRTVVNIEVQKTVIEDKLYNNDLITHLIYSVDFNVIILF